MSVTMSCHIPEVSTGLKCCPCPSSDQPPWKGGGPFPRASPCSASVPIQAPQPHPAWVFKFILRGPNGGCCLPPLDWVFSGIP